MIAFLMRAEETTGRIVEHRSTRTRYGGGAYPVVEFQGPDGKMLHFNEDASDSESSGGWLETLIMIPIVIILIIFSKRANSADSSSEDIVKVLYDPNKPSRAYIKSWPYLHGKPALLIVLGFLICSAGIPVMYDFYVKVAALFGDLADRLPSWLY